jgi:hypothetical protein
VLNPGKNVSLIKFSGRVGVPEPSVLIQSKSTAPTFLTSSLKLAFRLPKGANANAITQIRVGYVQTVSITGSAIYTQNPPGELPRPPYLTRALTIAGTTNGMQLLDWLYPKYRKQLFRYEPGAVIQNGSPVLLPVDETKNPWPWYYPFSLAQVRQPSMIAYPSLGIISDRPKMVLPLRYPAVRGLEGRLWSGQVIMRFSLSIASTSTQSPTHFSPIYQTPWSVNFLVSDRGRHFAYLPSSNNWQKATSPQALNLNLLPATIAAMFPYATWPVP